MFIRHASLFFAALLPAAIAQQAGIVEGRVTSSTSHSPIAGVAVDVDGQHAITDVSGTFRFLLPPGGYRFLFEAGGFFKLETTLRLQAGITAHLDAALIPESSISGRVLDDEGKPMSGVHVEVTEAVRGTGTSWTIWGATSDTEGRYRV